MGGLESHKILQIELLRLVPHPRNANVMSPDRLKKLRSHVQGSGQYEPLIVRPHPTRAADYELINGHHRKRVLESLGYTHADCLVWQLDDRQALLLLATINRLSGRDAPSKRLRLLESLGREVQLGELAGMLPEEEGTLRALLEKSEPPVMRDAPPPAEMPEAFTVFLKGEEKQRVVQALRARDGDLGRALVKVVLRGA